MSETYTKFWVEHGLEDVVRLRVVRYEVERLPDGRVDFGATRQIALTEDGWVSYEAWAEVPPLLTIPGTEAALLSVEAIKRRVGRAALLALNPIIPDIQEDS